MYTNKNLNFQNFFPNEKFRKIKGVNQKNFEILIKKAKESVEIKNNTLNSFSKNFKLNFKFGELKNYKNFKRVIIIGLGGSILGAQAINSFLKRNTKKEFIFINDLNLIQINKLKNIKHLKNSLFIIISKSGNTIEVLSIIDSLKNIANFNKRNSLVITENKKSYLSNFAKKLKIKIIYHKKYIGGRYSIFSETALVPSQLMGIDIIKFKKNIHNFLNKKKSILIKNLINLSKIYNSKKINSLILLNYCPGLEYFLLWCQQLIAESLGKGGHGKTPLISIGPRDHHSLLQLFLDGPKNNFFYIFSFKGKKSLKKKKGLFTEAINNHNLENIVENQKNAMTSVLKNKKIPYISIEIKKRNEETLGELFSYFILETILMGQNLKINPFNQPAVEEIKKLTRKNLFKKNQK